MKNLTIDNLVAFDKILCRILEWILVILLGVFLMLVCILVILRYGFASSILGGNEFVTIAFLFTSAIGGAVCLSRREHIAITVFIDLLPIVLKKAVYIIGLLLICLINGYLIYYSIGWIEMAGHYPWQPLGWPQGIVHAAIPVGCSLTILFCIIKIILTLAGREKVDILWLPED